MSWRKTPAVAELPFPNGSSTLGREVARLLTMVVATEMETTLKLNKNVKICAAMAAATKYQTSEVCCHNQITVA